LKKYLINVLFLIQQRPWSAGSVQSGILVGLCPVIVSLV
jgi:hypothetical protein